MWIIRRDYQGTVLYADNEEKPTPKKFLAAQFRTKPGAEMLAARLRKKGVTGLSVEEYRA